MLKTFSDIRSFRRDPLRLLQERGRGEDPLPRLHLGPKPIHLVADPTLVREVLRAEESDIDKGRHIAKLRQVVGLNSVTLSGPEQRRRRSGIHRALVEGLSGGFVTELAGVVRSWIVALGTEATFDARQTCAHLTLRVICSILFGPSALTKGEEALLIGAVRLVEDDLASEMFRVLPLTPWAALAKRERLARARTMMALVVERTCRRATSTSLLRMLQELGLGPDELRDEILMILIAGHHTTGAAAAWLLYAIAADPNLSNHLAGEAAQITKEADDITPLALRSASVSRALTFEILRLYPSIHWISRDLRRDQTLAGQPLKAGTTLLVSQWHLHRDPRYWTDPDTLRLDRAWTSNPAYLPFGFGPRACTGMSVASLMLQLIALEVAATFTPSVLTRVPAGPPRSSITLVPPEIRIGLRLRSPLPMVASEAVA